MPAKLLAGRYELRELLGEGGMGFVYRALDTRTGGFVAVKTMRDSSDLRGLEMFKKEWGTLALLSHPNIVDIRDVDQIEEGGLFRPCFVMPLLPGVTLGQLIKDSSPRLTVKRVIGMICQVCNGLEAAHKQQIFHRDLKPSNIFIMEDDTAKIIDFGLVHSADAHSVTGYKGTWQYMAPEQTEGKTPNAWSDIFALGIVTYEALTGRKPFARASVEETIEAVRRFSPPAISEINPKVSQILSKVIHKAMAKSPMHRYTSAREYADTLQSALHNEAIALFDASRIQPRIERSRAAFARNDHTFASEILTELEAEGHVDPEMTLLRSQIDEAIKQKKLQSLFEAVQTRLEQDEIPLALDKLREIISVDPENVEAAAMRTRIEEQRNSQQISDWMRLAQQHLQLDDYQEARQSLKELLSIRYDDSDALQLLSEVDVREKEAIKARADKEQLYGSALKAYQGGEISTALSKLEKILDLSRNTPGASVPERDAVYQSFYNRIRSERDTIDKAYEDGRQFLNAKEFQKAIEVCDQMLAKYPGSAQFQALKLKVEQAERQELSAYIAEIGATVDAEANLSRRVNILEEACKRYPNEVQFQQSLRLVREHRDLVDSISTKARQYEEQGQYTDALGQWKILRNIHPSYPGLDFELSHLEKRREQQAEEERKARSVEQIDRAIENGAYSSAVQLSQKALAEFPQDVELLALEKISRQGLERIQEAERLFEEAKRLRIERRYEEALTRLDQALQLDERNLGIRNALTGLYVESAHFFLDTDWRKAESMADSAARLDDDHPGLKRLRTVIADTKRKDLVNQCVAEARELQAGGQLTEAMQRLDNGLAVYPGETRLLQYQSSLQNTLQQREARAERFPEAVSRELKAPASIEERYPAAPVSVDYDTLDSLYERSEAPLYKAASAGTGSEDTQPTPVIRAAVQLSDGTSVSVPEVEHAPAESRPPVWQTRVRQLRARLEVLALQQQARWHEWKIGRERVERRKLYIAGGLLLVLCIVGIGIYRARSPKGALPAKIQSARQVSKDVAVKVFPEDASIRVDGEVRSAGTLTLSANKKYDVDVTRPGYKTLHRNEISADQPWQFTLQPEAVHIQVLTAERSGKILLDGKEVWSLQDGDLTDYEMTPGAGLHTLVVKNATAELLHVQFEAPVASVPKISPFDNDDLLVASSLGSQATIMAGKYARTVNLPNQPPTPLVRSGTVIDLAGGDPDQTVLTVSDGRTRRNLPLPHGNAPTLCLSLNGSVNMGSALISANVPEAQLFVDGKERKTKKPGTWRVAAAPGLHEVRLVAPGFGDEVLKVQIEKGKELTQSIEMKPASAMLSVEGGQAGAQVVVDGSPAGTVDSGGAMRLPISPGTHRIEFHKEDFESTVLTRTFSAGQPTTLRGKEIALRELGTLFVTFDPAGAQVTYRRIDETDPHTISTSGPIKVRAGAYEVFASASDFISQTQSVIVPAGKVERTELHLTHKVVAVSLPSSPYQDPSRVKTVENHWSTGETNISIQLKPASNRMLSFLEPGRVPLKHKAKHIEWRLAIYPDAEISFELDGQQIIRKVKSGGKNFKSNVKADVSDGEASYTVRVALEAHRVVIKSKGGQVIDEYTDDQHDWSKALISFRGDQYFLVQ